MDSFLLYALAAGLGIALLAGPLGSIVVWNPGVLLCSLLSDLPADGYRSMLCVEAAQIDAAVPLALGGRWNGWQMLKVMDTPGAPAPD